ncbi:protein FAM161A-like [Xyrichtys novacula]|uniref:Protein FAM161A n=1 Tax=Xyrichtys novacula TaxID=13765 RepID=A0AAV1G2I1_XYRNO|nr:protein FAM161A-like [Xyrichtys novacula]
MYRSPSLENKELMVLYGGEGEHFFVSDEDCGSEDYDLNSECNAETKGCRKVRRSLSLEIYGLQREQNVCFTNQEYYRRLEELKSAHLRNMAELEKMYISQGKRGDNEGGVRGEIRETEQSFRKLQRINSQEELDFQETSSGSDQSELCGTDSTGELELDNPNRTHGLDRAFGREILLSPEEITTREQFRFQPKVSFPSLQEKVSRQGGIRVRPNSKVTVPKPFQMMLREEEKKRHRVRTRSEVELENTLLRQELEELRECQKQFRASPAPAHIYLPLYDIISRRSSQRPSWNRSDNNNNINKNNQVSNAVSAQPFHFLERERRKREAKIVAELGKQGLKKEFKTFKAQPLPSSVYGTRHRGGARTTSRQLQSTTWTQGREVTKSDSNPDMELDVVRSKSDTTPDSSRAQKCLHSKPVKKQIELSIEMVKERQWS